ncbi:hypothetical protein K1719_012050 [Acacia pycnantha]|nr:hypothetical protein K1719_012050 [Acacia pycnantha]
MQGVANTLTQSVPSLDANQAQKNAWAYANKEITDDKDIKLQINKNHKLNVELRAEKIDLLDEFMVGVLIEKMPNLWNDYKQLLKHKQKKLSLNDLITHIIIEGDDSGDKEIIVAMVSQALLVFDVKKWVVDSRATDPFVQKKEMFTSFEEGEDNVYLAGS